MGVRNYLIEGVSGVGKTTVAEELERRHHVIHGDRHFAYIGDPETGRAVEPPPNLSDTERIEWSYKRWIWPVELVEAQVADCIHPMTFFCGGSRNSHRFIHLFDTVFVLDVDLATLRTRLALRGADEFGGKPLERDLVLRVHAAGWAMPERAVRINTARPVGAVVEDILHRCSQRG